MISLLQMRHEGREVKLTRAVSGEARVEIQAASDASAWTGQSFPGEKMPYLDPGPVK